MKLTQNKKYILKYYINNWEDELSIVITFYINKLFKVKMKKFQLLLLIINILKELNQFN